MHTSIHYDVVNLSSCCSLFTSQQELRIVSLPDFDPIHSMPVDSAATLFLGDISEVQSSMRYTPYNTSRSYFVSYQSMYCQVYGFLMLDSHV